MTADYVAGFFDGEGTVWIRTFPNGRRSASLSLYNTHWETLEAIHVFLGVGVLKPRAGMAARRRVAPKGPKPQWQLVIQGNKQARRILSLLQPLVITKREAVDAALQVIGVDRQRTCTVCGKQFESTNRDALYCRKACNQAVYVQRKRAEGLRPQHRGPRVETGDHNSGVVL